MIGGQTTRFPALTKKHKFLLVFFGVLLLSLFLKPGKVAAVSCGVPPSNPDTSFAGLVVHLHWVQSSGAVVPATGNVQVRITSLPTPGVKPNDGNNVVNHNYGAPWIRDGRWPSAIFAVPLGDPCGPAGVVLGIDPSSQTLDRPNMP